MLFSGCSLSAVHTWPDRQHPLKQGIVSLHPLTTTAPVRSSHHTCPPTLSYPIRGIPLFSPRSSFRVVTCFTCCDTDYTFPGVSFSCSAADDNFGFGGLPQSRRCSQYFLCMNSLEPRDSPIRFKAGTTFVALLCKKLQRVCHLPVVTKVGSGRARN